MKLRRRRRPADQLAATRLRRVGSRLVYRRAQTGRADAPVEHGEHASVARGPAARRPTIPRAWPVADHGRNYNDDCVKANLLAQDVDLEQQAGGFRMANADELGGPGVGAP